MSDAPASAVVSAVVQIHGRGWALELADLDGVVRRGDWVGGFSAPHQDRFLQVLAVELVDRRCSPGGPSAAIAVVVAKLKSPPAAEVEGQRVSFSPTHPHEANLA